MDRLQVCASRGRAKYFLIQTELTKSTSILSYGGCFFVAKPSGSKWLSQAINMTLDGEFLSNIY